MNPTYQELLKRIETLEQLLGVNTSFEEKIRDTIFFDVDNSTSPTRVAVDSHADTVTVPLNPAKFARVYVKGQVYNCALYTIT